MYRQLQSNEIEILKGNDCWADNWKQIMVNNDFNPSRYHIVGFSGDVKLGSTNGKIVLEGGISVNTGIFNAKIHNCIIGDNSYINNINQHIANYDIGNNVVINNIDIIYTSGYSTFGNGIKIAVLNETGGRDVMMYNNLSSHLAYIMAMYRHESILIEQLESMITDYSNNIKSDRGKIGNNVKITNCRSIKSVNIGDCAIISGASRLENGSINSNCDAIVYIGDYVIATDFIICNSTKIKDGAIIDKCFIGQGCDMGKQYSAENCLFFANCVGMHGEACSIFAGPYTVTHHKSTLLIAGLFSFMNAGSGSNQSNHMYKLGPIHQGIVDRGSKTTSDSYILWPSKIGPFSMIMGRHYNNCDTTFFPFSYLIESNDNSYLIPGVNLKSVGTIRDAKKWPKRDNRIGNKIDQLNFNLLSPYTIHKMLKGQDRLNALLSSDSISDVYTHENCILKRSSVLKGLEYYEIAIRKFIGNSIIKRLEDVNCDSINEIRSALKPKTNIGLGDWVDLSGLISPKTEIIRIIESIKSGAISNLEDIHTEFVILNDNYYEYEWSWVYQELTSQHNKHCDMLTKDDLISYIEIWIDMVVKLDTLIYEDAKKEFTLTSKTGFGVDGDINAMVTDFKNVRGEFNNNSFVLEVLKHIDSKTKLGKDLISRLRNIRD